MLGGVGGSLAFVGMLADVGGTLAFYSEPMLGCAGTMTAVSLVAEREETVEG